MIKEFRVQGIFWLQSQNNYLQSWVLVVLSSSELPF